MSEESRNKLYEEIIAKADIVSERLNACIELEKENTIHYENIRKLEQLLAKHNLTMEQENYDMDSSDAEKQADLDDISRINMELDVLKDTATKVFEIKKENIEFISAWKKDVIKYVKAECYEIQKKYINKLDSDEIEKDEIAETEEKSDSEIPTIPAPTGDEFIDDLRSQSIENIAMVKTLINNIKNLISKQQNHARIAEALDSNYKALNNAFEMRNFAEELDSLVKAINDKIEINLENREILEKIATVNIQISTLINYLNNPKSSIQKRITRFDEINIIEENELKREIAETIKNIRCEAELKKLRDDIEIIEDKSNIKKFFERLTGKSKLNETMLDQIEVRQTAIRKTFKNKMPLAYNYSIHALIAEIEMFIKENKDDELVLEDINNLRKIEQVLKKNFVIIDSKVVSIIDQKTGKNLPLASRKLTKKELIEIDTYRFLNRYGYDKSVSNNEPEYQDTMANEIKTIVEYIKSSNIL